MRTYAQHSKPPQHTRSAESAAGDRARGGQGDAAHVMAYWQRAAGNRATQRLLAQSGLLPGEHAAAAEDRAVASPGPPPEHRPRQAGPAPLLQRACACGGEGSGEACECPDDPEPFLQPKLRIGAPHDAYEHEADRVAEQMTRAPETAGAVLSASPQISRTCTTCEADAQDDGLQRKAAGARGADREAPALVHEVLGSPGRPLDAWSRAYFEPRFRQDLSQVRIHDDARAATSARAVNALAYTSGQHIVFGTGAYEPRSGTGRKLLAHELTHTVQQSALSARTAPAAGVLQRQAQSWESMTQYRSGFGSGFGSGSDTELYFGMITDVCETCHQPSEQNQFQRRKVQHARVTESKIREWAASEIVGEAFSGKKLNRKTLFSLLQRGEDKKLHDIWNSYRTAAVGKIRPNRDEEMMRPVFIGSDTARDYWAHYVEEAWPAVVADLDRQALDRLVREIDDILHTRVIPAGATLVTDPARVVAIQDSPGTEKIRLERFQDTATRGFEWMGKRIKSARKEGLDFEVIGHEGIYFEISPSDFQKAEPFMGEYAGEVAAATKVADSVGQFIKGLLTAAASPGTMVLDTAARAVDMTSQGIAALGTWRGWYDIGYTCLSSTCQQYEKCIKDAEEMGGDKEHCRSDALRGALEEATVIIPLYRQGRECLVDENAEACGGIAALALGLVKERGTPLEMTEFEHAAIRSAIKRPRAGDPDFAKALEKPRERAAQPGKPPAKGRTEPPARAQPHEPAPAGHVTKPVARAAASDAAIARFATANKISLKQLSADLAELRKNARDPGKVHRPADPHFDAEVSTSAHGESHEFRREKPAPGHESEPRIWCRRSPPPGACGLKVDPEVDKMIDEHLVEYEGTQTTKKSAPAKEKPLTAAEYKKVKAAAEKEFKYGPKHIGAEVGRHRDASAIRAGEGVSGKNVQSAHVAPSSFMKTLDDYLRNEADTMHLERSKHFSFDQIWKDWAQDQRRLGRTEVTVQELHGAMAEAIERAPVADAQKSALSTLLHDEFQKHGLTSESKLPLPYGKTPALKPGPELTALKAREAARERVRERADIEHKISIYTRTLKDLERAGNKARAQMYRLKIEKLKGQLKK